MEINCKYEDNVILYTRCSEDVCVFLLSLPVRGRGLKFFCQSIFGLCHQIAACAVAWIEIQLLPYVTPPLPIAACAVAWIEIRALPVIAGLLQIAACAVAWIEIAFSFASHASHLIAACAVAWIEIG